MAQSRLNTNRQSRGQFFFAEAAAGMYDLTIGLVVPHYAIMHELVLYLLKAGSLKPGDTVLDVGSGTGTDSIAILSAFPGIRVVSLDLCGPIQEVHRRKLHELDSPKLRLLKRSILVCADIMSYRSAEQLMTNTSEGPFAAVISSLTIHHLGHTEKQRFYKMMYGALSPKGKLINADLFSYSNRGMSRKATEFDLAWMRREFRNPSDEAARTVPSARRAHLLKRWIEHYRRANRLEPLEDRGGAHGQLSMVQRAGFRNAHVPYRMSLSGILYAEK